MHGDDCVAEYKFERAIDNVIFGSRQIGSRQSVFRLPIPDCRLPCFARVLPTWRLCRGVPT